MRNAPCEISISTQVKAALEARAQERREEIKRRDEYVKKLVDKAASGGAEDADPGTAAPAAEEAPKKAAPQIVAPKAAPGDGRAETETQAAAPPRAVKAWAWASRFEARMMKLEDKLDATAAGGGHAAARALEERLARIEETLQEVAARPSKNS